MCTLVCEPCKEDKHEERPAVKKASRTWCDCQHGKRKRVST